MGKIIKEHLAHSVPFWVCLLVSLILILLGFIVPPMGVIHPSVLTAVGELFAFATLAVVAVAIKEGYEAKITHGETSVELNNKP